MLLDPPLGHGTYRFEDRLSRPDADTLEKKLPDTLLLTSAVCFPVSYDWRRDSACGKVSCELKLYRNGEEALSVPAGPGTRVSASADGHQLIDGAIFTFYADDEGTFVGRNGVPLAEWPDRETLVGLVYRESKLYTLSSGMSGGFVFRCDGAPVLESLQGTVLGGFGKDTYGPTGALYEDCGRICFAYHAKAKRSGITYLVADGVPCDSLIYSFRMRALDAKLLGGRSAFLVAGADVSWLSYDGESQRIDVGWTEAGLMELDGGIAAVGRNSLGECSVFAGGELRRLDGLPDYIYNDGASLLPLDLDASGFSSCFFMKRDCATVFDGSLALALTPRDDGFNPFVLYHGVRTEFPIFGFLTGVSFQIPE